jgi:hypothetical protein
MIEAVTFWNEPNNKSHWDFEVDPEWGRFAEMVKRASHAVRKKNPGLIQVLGGTSPIDAGFAYRLEKLGVLQCLDAFGVHGFPLDWNHWQINEWPERLNSIQSAILLPVWITEVGVSTFGADEVQLFGLQRSAELLKGLVPRIHWYSLYDLPKAWPATTRHRESEGYPTIAIFIWGWSERMEQKNFRTANLRGTLLNLEFVSGSISTIIGWKTRSYVCKISGCVISAPVSAGRIVFGLALSTGLTAKSMSSANLI